MYCLYEKYYKLITVQKYIANYVSWVPGLTYKQIGLTNALSEQNLCICRGLTVKVKVTQSCPTLCDPIDYSPWNSPGQNTRVGSLSLLQGIFPTQGSDPGLLPCRWILYQLSHKGSPRRLEWVVFPFSSRSSQPSNWTRVSCIAGGFFTNWTMRKAFWTYCLQKKIKERNSWRVVMLRGRGQSQWKLRNGKFLVAHLVYLWAYVKPTTTLPKVLQNTWATFFRRLVVLRE